MRDHENLAITNTLDAVGSLSKVVRDGGRGNIEASMIYDDMGRKIQSNDPDAGSWKTVYNAAGEVIEQIALHPGQSQRIRQRYDARGRVFAKTVFNAQGLLESTTNMVYDTAANGRGQVATETVSGDYLPAANDGEQAVAFLRSVSYDAMGRAHGGTTTIDQIGYSTAVQFDGLSRPWKALDASGRWLKTEFGPRGHALAQCESTLGDQATTCPAGSTTYVRNLKTDERGNVVLERRGDLAAMEVKRSYSQDRGRLDQLCAGNVANCGVPNASQILQDERHGWDALGNLSYRDKAGQYREEFDYDALNRLKTGRYTRVM